MSTSDALNYTSALCGAAAAVLWFCSASVRIPKYVRQIDLGSYSGNIDVDVEPTEMDDLQKLTVGLSWQSRLSASPAIAAGAAAMLQACATYASIH
jgi:hypothetical protein